MLCQNCEKAIQAAAKHLRPAQGLADFQVPNVQRRLNSSFLHFSLREFRRSIASGCYFCRHLEKFLRPDVRFRTGDEHIHLDFRPPRLVDKVLTRAVHWTIQHILIPCLIYTEASLIQRLLDAAQQLCTSSYLFWIHIDPSLRIEVQPVGFKGIHNSLPGLGSQPSWNGTSFLLSPISSDISSAHPQSDTSLWTGRAWTGDSTALWRHWFNKCLGSHATCRSAEQSLRDYSPKRLVELLLDDHGSLFMWRLVYADMIGKVPYFTLSHCWGSSQPLRLTKDNISSLSKPSPITRLPETYRHALAIVNSLGHKHLWIDSLCIIQDDEKDWKTESLLMGLTYSHAVCNIAATWATGGADGCFSTRDPTTVCPTFITLGFEVNDSSTFQISYGNEFAYFNDIEQAPLNKRGWVVQERYLTRRQLSSAKRQFYWECHELSASEEFPYGHPVIKANDSISIFKPNEIPPKPSLYSERGAHTRLGWAQLVELYSGCQLTRASDKLIALSGLANQLQNNVSDVYVSGLWTKDLCQQLCWEPPYMSSSPRTTTQGRIAPTWSWANFDGPIRFDQAYYDSTWREYKHWTEVAETPTDSTRRLTLRGLALKSRILWRNTGHPRGGTHDYQRLSFDRLRTPYIPASSSTQIMLRWDENMSQEDVDSEEWSNFQKQRNSDLLFLVIRSETPAGITDVVKGLILRVLPHADDPVLYSRMGTFMVYDTRAHALGHVFSFLASHEGDTEDIMAAELIQTVTLI